MDEHSYLLGSTTKLINIIDKKSNSGRKAVSLLDITQIDFICNILIPYLETLEFRTKKHKDFLDWVKAAEIIKKGDHLTTEGSLEIINIKAGMNTGRELK